MNSDVAEKYDYYRKYLDKIAESPFSKTPKVSDIHLSRGAIDRGYAEMKRWSFTGGLVEFIVLVSALHLLETIVRRLKKFDWPVHADSIRAVIKDFAENDPVGASILVRSAPLIRVIDISEVGRGDFEDDHGQEKRVLVWRLVNRLWNNLGLLIMLESGCRDADQAEDIVNMIEKNGFKPLITGYLQSQSVAP